MAGTEHMRLTDDGVARLRPREREYTVWDTRVAGLGVRVRPSGGASIVLLRKAEGRSSRVSLGPVASTRIDDVRRRCHALMAEPESDKAAGAAHRAPLFRDFVSGPWKDAHFPRYEPSTRQGVSSALRNQLVPTFGATPLDRITRHQVLRWFDAYSQTAPWGAASSTAGSTSQAMRSSPGNSATPPLSVPRPDLTGHTGSVLRIMAMEANWEREP